VKRLLLFAILAMALVACKPEPLDPPTVHLESPADGVRVAQGERLLVQSVAQGKQLAKTELWVDGRLYEIARPEDGVRPDNGEPEFAAIQIWEAATLGPHTLTVKTFNRQGLVSESAQVEVDVVHRETLPTPTPQSVPTAAVAQDCPPSARFVEDVTVPDDSLYNAGVKFTKIWRLRNDGECTWPAGTRWVFIGGDLLGAQSPVEVELAEPERIIDVSVDMVAPAAPGTYKSYWRLQGPDDEYFGDQAYVRITVP
jgi:hypothetical protein